MRKLIYDKKEPSGDLRIVIPELNIIKWITYVCDRTFHKYGVYEQKIAEFDENNPDDILVIINDNSNHGYVKRCYMCVFTEDELRN